MRSNFTKLSTAVVLLSALFSNASIAASTSLSIPVTELKFVETGIGPIQRAQGYGDMFKGAHSNYVKLPALFTSPPHIHTEDYYAVVVSGVVANGLEGSEDIPLPSGSYWFQKGNEKHVTKCLSSTECVFFVTQSGKFDFLMSK